MKNFTKKLFVTAMMATTLASTCVTAQAQDFTDQYLHYSTIMNGGWLDKSSKFTQFNPLEINIGVERAPYGGSEFNGVDVWQDNEIPADLRDGGEYATYSSDWNTVGCWLDGNAIQLEGKKAGSATIYLQKKINGTWVTVDYRKVNVNDSYLTATQNYKHEYSLGEQDSWLRIENRKKDAIYSYETSDPVNAKVYEVGFNDNSARYGYIAVNIQKPGTYTLKIKETYKGVTKEFQTVTIHGYGDVIADTATFDLNTNIEEIGYYKDSVNGNFIDEDSVFTFMNNDYNYVFKNNDGTPSFIDNFSFGTSNRDYYAIDYEVPNKCFVIQNKDGFDLTFSQTGNCKVDIYRFPKYNADGSYNAYTKWEKDRIDQMLEYVKTIDVTVIDSSK